MVVSYEVGTYKVLLLSGYANKNQVGFVYLNDPAGKYLGYVGIMKDGSSLPANTQWTNGVVNLFFYEAQLVALLDTLRNESPIFLMYHPDLKWGSVGTDKEPVGEGDEEPG